MWGIIHAIVQMLKRLVLLYISYEHCIFLLIFLLSIRLILTNFALFPIYMYLFVIICAILCIVGNKYLHFFILKTVMTGYIPRRAEDGALPGNFTGSRRNPL